MTNKAELHRHQLVGGGVMIISGVAVIVSQLTATLPLLIAGVLGVLIGAIIMGGSGKGRWGRTVRALGESLWWLP